MKTVGTVILFAAVQVSSASLLRGNSDRLLAASSSTSGASPVGTADAVVIGGGIAGHTAMWEMAQRGIGSSKGITLIEKDPNDFHVCGIIEPINFAESSGTDKSPFSPNYKPFRFTTHAMRINIATQNQMRYVEDQE